MEELYPTYLVIPPSPLLPPYLLCTRISFQKRRKALIIIMRIAHTHHFEMKILTQSSASIK